MQNKPNLLNAQISVSAVITKDYGNVQPCGHRQNVPKNAKKCEKSAHFAVFCDVSTRLGHFLPRLRPSRTPFSPPNHDRFMQNKPNLLDTQMNVTTVITKDYGNMRVPGPRKNKPNSPIEDPGAPGMNPI